MAGYACHHAQSARLPKQDSPEIIHDIFPFRFNNEKPVGDQFTEDESFFLAAPAKIFRERPP